MRFLLISALLLFAPILAHAEDHAAGTRINLSASAAAQLPSDEVVISFRVEKQGQDAEAVRQYVNRVSSAIEQRLQTEKGAKLKTLSRRMQPVWKYAKKSQRVRVGWQMIQVGQIASTRLERVPQWLGAIESAGANLSSLSFRVSSAVSQQARASLRGQAVRNFRTKAAGMAKELDANSFRIIHLNASSRMPQPRIYRADMAMLAKATAQPALSAGSNRISVTVSGEIEVPFIDFPTQ